MEEDTLVAVPRIVLLKEEDARYTEALTEACSGLFQSSSSLPLTYIPVLHVTTRPDAAHTVCELLQRHPRAGVVITSANAVKALAAPSGGNADRTSMLLQGLKGRLGFFVGEKTAAQAVQHLRLEPQAVATKAADLAEQLVASAACPRYLFLCGQPHRPELPQALREHDMALDEVCCYESEVSQAALDNLQHLIRTAHASKEPTVLVLFSPSVAEQVNRLLLTDVNTALVRVVTIGPTTAAGITAVEAIPAAKPSPTHVARAVALAVQQLQPQPS